MKDGQEMKAIAATLLLAATIGFGAPCHAQSNLDEAMLAYEDGKYARAVEGLRAAAQEGDGQAQEMLGFMYALGTELYPGVARDAAEARAWFLRAASNGRPVARYMACALRRGEAAAQIGGMDCAGRSGAGRIAQAQ